MRSDNFLIYHVGDRTSGECGDIKLIYGIIPDSVSSGRGRRGVPFGHI